ncbi:hypothetical protein HHK36_021738 [Tetracentron sinense]|uniref:RRM domain-containing protein n=1 Tax=Tetracentron sinense TaxID=13715 RepID=A0A834YQA6_TETSI|nr:hypothetical protein HHK36_021738 [Tetracentron sinense]
MEIDDNTSAMADLRLARIREEVGNSGDRRYLRQGKDTGKRAIEGATPEILVASKGSLPRGWSNVLRGVTEGKKGRGGAGDPGGWLQLFLKRREDEVRESVGEEGLCAYSQWIIHNMLKEIDSEDMGVIQGSTNEAVSLDQRQLGMEENSRGMPVLSQDALGGPGGTLEVLHRNSVGVLVVAFANFFNHQSAMAALHSLNGVKFDPQTGATLHIELARSNSRRKRPPVGGAYVVIDKRVKAAADGQEISSNDGDRGSDEPSDTESPNYRSKGDLATAESGQTVYYPDNTGAAINEQSEKPVEGSLPPCSTLFIANLGPNCTEDELKQVFSQIAPSLCVCSSINFSSVVTVLVWNLMTSILRAASYAGFHVLKMRSKGGMPVAFADFEDVERATEAMHALQGSILASSDRGGLHLEYARSKMRKPYEKGT